MAAPSVWATHHDGFPVESLLLIDQMVWIVGGDLGSRQMYSRGLPGIHHVGAWSIQLPNHFHPFVFLSNSSNA